ncbi:unnamed protein product [Oreochromis niloticus]|nr:unnamed protein product [Mustela putorius furo]
MNWEEPMETYDLNQEHVKPRKRSKAGSAAEEETRSCSVPVGHFWYVNHMYKEEMKRIEKENGVKIEAELKLKFQVDKKHGSPDNALKEFKNLMQNSITESSGSVIPLKFIDPDQWRDALKTIQKSKKKLLVTLTCETITVQGPRHSQDVISKSLFGDTVQHTNTHAFLEEYEKKNLDTSLKTDRTTKDLWPMTTFCNKEVDRIKAGFNVEIKESDINQGKVSVKTLHKQDEGHSFMKGCSLKSAFQPYRMTHRDLLMKTNNISQSEGASNEPVLNGQSANRMHNTDRPTDSGTTAGDQKDERCPICLDKFKNKKRLKCKDEFCEDCLKQALEANGPICPVCRVVFGKIIGDQPDGRMSHQIHAFPLPGYSDCGTIVINYVIPSGIQTAKHPNPGQPYSGIRRTACLPDNKEGNEVLQLLKRAFQQRLIFTVGTSRTTGLDNQVTWNDIAHKTSTSGGPNCFGYPDPEYLSRVKEELKAKGIE